MRHCPLLLTTLVSAFRETRRNQYMNFPITRHSVDSSLVTSHDYDTVSCLSSALDSLIMAEHKLPTRNGKSQTSTGHSAGKRWCSISQEELVYLAFRLRGAGNFSYYPHLPEIKILIESLHLTCGLMRLSDAGSLMKDHCWREARRGQHGLQSSAMCCKRRILITTVQQ